jgi:hypothetical protein
MEKFLQFEIINWNKRIIIKIKKNISQENNKLKGCYDLFRASH